MSGIRVRVDLEDAAEALEVTYDGRDVRAWEADTGESYLATPDTYTQREHLAWYALRRKGLLELDLESFRAVCVQVTALGPGEPADPTQPAPMAGPS